MYAKWFKVKCHGIYNLLSNSTEEKAGWRHEKFDHFWNQPEESVGTVYLPHNVFSV